jgi:hypothetical protein
MSKAIIIILSIIGLIIIFAFGYGCSAFSFRQECVKAEAGIEAQYKQNQNNYDNMWKKFKEVSGVPKMYANDMKEMWEKAMSARYGGEGKPMFRWIQEHNPQLDSATYTQLQRTLEAGRNSFAADQKQLLDRKRAYDVVLKGNRALFVNMWWGFPRTDLSKFDIVTSDKTEEVFAKKKDNEVLFTGE